MAFYPLCPMPLCSGEFHDVIQHLFQVAPNSCPSFIFLMLRETPYPFCKSYVVVSATPMLGWRKSLPGPFLLSSDNILGLRAPPSPRGSGTQDVCGWSVLSRCSLFISSSLPKSDVRTSIAQALSVGTMSREGKATHGKRMAVVARVPACLPGEALSP